MSTGAVRRVVVAVCAAGIAGMIVASINDNNGAALTFGLITSVAVVCLVVATAVAHPVGGAGPAVVDAGRGAGPMDEKQAARVEDLVAGLVAAGADERDLRTLVREAVRLGRGRHS